MDLLKYLEPMKNLPKRFSNLAFWRDVRKFKDEVVNAFEYVDSWGESIEKSIDSQYMGYEAYGLLGNFNFSNLLTISSISQYNDGVFLKPNYVPVTETQTGDCEIDRVCDFIPVLWVDGGTPSVIVDISTILSAKVVRIYDNGTFDVQLDIGSIPNLYVPLPKNLFTNLPSSATLKLSLYVKYRA